jgi:hypothetical protein
MAGSSNVSWGTLFSYGLHDFGWSVWGTSCADILCRQVTWGSPDSENVVWGTSCGGADCQNGTPWSSPGGAGTLLWRVGDGQTIVWGTSDGDSDTIVWGTTCTPSCTH